MTTQRTRPVAVVTGAARGIGAAITQRLVTDGYHVLAVDRDSIGTAPAAVTSMRLDIGDAAAPETLVQAAAHLGPVRALVQAAGVMRVAHPQDVDMAHWDEVMAVNARAPWFIANAFLRHAPELARVVFVASTAGKTATTVMHPIYNVSKAAVIAMTKTLAMSVASQHITVNCVCPGVIETAMQHQVTAALAAQGHDADQVWQQRIARVPMGHAGIPDDVADMVAFLVSDAARFVTGQAVNVCGGMVM